MGRQQHRQQWGRGKPEEMSELNIRTLSHQLVDVVRRRILTGDAPADQPIRQDALAAELGVSKIPLREALTRLEQEGLVRSHANRGYFVRGLDPAEAEEVYSLRLKLEPDTAARAAQRASPAEQAAAQAAFAALDAHQGDRREALVTVNRDFHLALVRPSQLPLTVQLLERLLVLSDRYVRKHLEPLGRDERAVNEHAVLLSRWLARDADGVAEAARQHLEHGLIDLRRQLAADAAPPVP
jgi:DNA-binding GntR family transcriptional regulator